MFYPKHKMLSPFSTQPYLFILTWRCFLFIYVFLERGRGEGGGEETMMWKKPWISCLSQAPPTMDWTCHLGMRPDQESNQHLLEYNAPGNWAIRPGQHMPFLKSNNDNNVFRKKNITEARIQEHKNGIQTS